MRCCALALNATAVDLVRIGFRRMRATTSSDAAWRVVVSGVYRRRRSLELNNAELLDVTLACAVAD